jgi:hypothetical protein
MTGPVDWSDNDIRRECHEGTKRQLQAYLDNGYIRLNGFPMDANDLAGVAKTRDNKAPPRPFIPKIDQKSPPPVETYLLNDFSGHSRMIEVADAVCKKHNISFKAMCGNGRSRDLVIARRELFYICYFKLGKSTSQIGKAFKKDHTTIVHHLQVCTGKKNVQYYRTDQEPLHS